MDIRKYMIKDDLTSPVRSKTKLIKNNKQNEDNIILEATCDYYGFHAKSKLFKDSMLRSITVYCKKGKKHKITTTVAYSSKEYYESIKIRNNLNDDYYTYIIKSEMGFAYSEYKKK